MSQKHYVDSWCNETRKVLDWNNYLDLSMFKKKRWIALIFLEYNNLS